MAPRHLILMLLVELRVSLLLGHPWVVIKVEPVVVPRVHIRHASLAEHIGGLDPSPCVHLSLTCLLRRESVGRLNRRVRRLDVNWMALASVSIASCLLLDK